MSRLTLEQELSKNGKADQVQAQMGSHVGPGMPDLSALSPHLQMDWHPDNNVLLGGRVVKPYKDLLTSINNDLCWRSHTVSDMHVMLLLP